MIFFSTTRANYISSVLLPRVSIMFMNFQTFTWLSFLHFLSVLLQSSYGFSHPEEYYHTCGTTFSCGSITEIGYPFRGHNDPLYCGHPSLVLTCDDHYNLTTIDIKNTTYRVLDIYQTTQTMRIVRGDVMGGACPQEMVNTTLDYTIFDYFASYTNFTFLYGCPALNLSGLSLISCGYDDVYVMSGTQGPVYCNTSVVVPVLLTGNGDGGFMNSTNLSQVLQQGFEIRWNIGNHGCSDCVESKGRCGYSFETARTTCFCPDPPYISDTCVMAIESSPSPGKFSLMLSNGVFNLVN